MIVGKIKHKKIQLALLQAVLVGDHQYYLFKKYRTLIITITGNSNQYKHVAIKNDIIVCYSPLSIMHSTILYIVSSKSIDIAL